MTGRITWFASFGIAVAAALLMRSLDADWLSTLSTSALTFVVRYVGKKAQPYCRGIYPATIPNNWKLARRLAESRR
jgi:hypothetical protein